MDTKKSILIVEDDEFLRGLIDTKLASEGFEVFFASDGKEGVKTVKEKKPDLVLLDLLLPIMDGFEVLSTIKSDSEVSATPVIILSNLDRKEDIDKGLKLGAVDYIIKSQFTVEEIIKRVKKALE